MRKSLWLLFPLLSIFPLRAQSTFAAFPGNLILLPSPDGNFLIRNIDGPGPLNHQLILEEKKTGVKRQVYDYQRSVAVMWAPDSRHFAVNDYESSNIGEAYIFGVRDSDAKIDLKSALDKLEIYHRVEWDHGYVGVAKWLDGRRAVIHFWGHGGDLGRTFCQCYVYSLNGSATPCPKQPRGGDLEQKCEASTP